MISGGLELVDVKYAVCGWLKALVLHFSCKFFLQKPQGQSQTVAVMKSKVV